jgi:NAD(P)-dependent dehydrogenase (short-subunit alcohol dehydrogenase family)
VSVAVAFAREGADVLICYLNEDSDAEEPTRIVHEAGRQTVLAPGDISEEAHCMPLVERTVSELGRFEILFSNSAYQKTRERIAQIPDGEREHTSKTNIFCPQYRAGRAPEMDRSGPRRAGS